MGGSTDDVAAAACALGRDHLLHGEPKAAVPELERSLAVPGAEHRGEAAFLLGVACAALGDETAAREAYRTAMATGEDAYAVPAAYCLAVSYERADDTRAAREVWQHVAAADTVYYRAPALFALATGYEREGRQEEAWTALLYTFGTADDEYAMKAAVKLASLLVERGEPGQARDFLTAAMAGRERGPGRLPPDRRACRDQATLALRVMLESSAPELVAAAAYGLARAEGWLDAADLADRPTAEAGGAEAPPRGAMPQTGAWWERYVADAVRNGTAAHLTWELFSVVDRMYRTIAVPYALGVETYEDPDELMAALAEVVTLPSGYVWGQSLHDSFRDALQTVLGADTPLLPADWPHRRVPDDGASGDGAGTGGNA